MECNDHPEAKVDVVHNAESNQWEYFCHECMEGIGKAPRPEDAPPEAPQ